jgi:hypothetical protein
MFSQFCMIVSLERPMLVESYKMVCIVATHSNKSSSKVLEFGVGMTIKCGQTRTIIRDHLHHHGSFFRW